MWRVNPRPTKLANMSRVPVAKRQKSRRDAGATKTEGATHEATEGRTFERFEGQKSRALAKDPG
jgi:hypothetical protein